MASDTSNGGMNRKTPSSLKPALQPAENAKPLQHARCICHRSSILFDGSEFKCNIDIFLTADPGGALFPISVARHMRSARPCSTLSERNRLRSKVSLHDARRISVDTIKAAE